MTTPLKFLRVKVWLSGRLLDFAEALPETKRGPIRHLQTIREFQRKGANEPIRDTRPPNDNDVALVLIRFIEAYSIENFDRLRLAIDRLFPDLRRDPSRRNLLNELDQSIRSLSAGAWWNIGMLVRERGRSFYSVPIHELARLPSQVESVHVRAHHIMPSIAVLVFDVQLNDDAAVELNNVQARPYLPEVAFRSIFRWQSGHTELPVEWVRQRHVRGWIDALRSDVEEVLKQCVPPGLFGLTTKRRPRLPAIEVYLLSAGGAAFSEDWAKQARGWLESYGIEPFIHAYRSDLALFQWPQVEQWYGSFISSHLLTLSRERYLATIQHPEGYGGEKNALLHHVEEALNGLIPVVVTLDVLRHTQSVIEDLRERVFRRIDAGGLFHSRRLTLPTKLHVELLGQSMLLKRLKAEFSRQERWISHDMHGWEELKFVPNLSDKDADLPSNALEWIHHELKRMGDHLDLARDAFAEHFTARNTRAIYVLTAAVTGLTVVQVLTNHDVWPYFTAALSAVKSLLSKSHP